jgi:hypothetical protein
MGVGDILGGAWDLYKAHWRTLVPIAVVFYAILGLITLLLSLVAGIFGALIGSIVSLLGVFLLVGTLVEAVADIRDGKADLSWRDYVSRVRPRFWTLVGAGLLAVLGIAGGLILLIVPGLILLTWWAVFAPVVVLERVGAVESLGRSRALVRGHGWTVFGVIVITYILLAVVNGVFSAIFIALPDWLGTYLANIAAGVTAPFGALAVTLMYFELAREKAGVEPTPAPSPIGL